MESPREKLADLIAAWGFFAPALACSADLNGVVSLGQTVFCLNCHALNNNPHFANVAHTGIACVGCHIRVPHGGKVSRLINTNSAGKVNRYSPGGDGTGTLYINEFKKANPGAYQMNNCFTTAACHGNLPIGGEAW